MFGTKSFLGIELATGVKIIGVIGVIKHFLSLVVYCYMIYVTWIIAEETSVEKKAEAQGITWRYVLSIFLDIVFAIFAILEVMNTLMCYRLYKPRRDRFLEELTNWLTLTKIYLVLGFITLLKHSYFNTSIATGFLISLFFDFYCFVCIDAYKSQVKETMVLLPTKN